MKVLATKYKQTKNSQAHKHFVGSNKMLIRTRVFGLGFFS